MTKGMTGLVVIGSALLAALLAGLPATTPATAQAPPDVIARATRIVVVTTPGWDSTAGELRRFARDDAASPWRVEGGVVPVVIGRSGLAWGVGFDTLAGPETPGAGTPTGDATPGPRKREGDGRSPAGAFPLVEAFGFAPADSADRFRLPYRALHTGVECVDDTASAHYNRVVDRAAVPDVDWRSAERMREIPVYRLGVVVGYNDAPVRGRGSCIFLHVWEGPASTTSGCTALDAGALRDVVAWLDAGTRPALVQLPAEVYARLRGPWGLPAFEEGDAATGEPGPLAPSPGPGPRPSG